MKLLNAIKMMFFNPDKYAYQIKNTTQKNSLLFILKSFTIFSILYLLLNIRGIHSRSLDAGSNTTTVLLTAFVFYIVIAVILIFIGTIILHIFAKLFKSKEKFSDTFAIYSYGALPFALIGWIPYIIYVGIIYTIYVQIVALKHGHYFSNKKAILAYGLHLIIISAIVGLLKIFYV